MTDNTNSNNKKVVLKFTGLDMNVEKANRFNEKVKSIKLKINDSIQKNINYENGIENKNSPVSELSPSMRILKDSGDYTVITLRCGAYPVFKNTTKKAEYSHLEILSSLKNMLNNGDFDEEIKSYARKKRTRKSNEDGAEEATSEKKVKKAKEK